MLGVAEKRGGCLVRAMLWCLLACTALGFAASSALVVSSLRPKPGANVVLMALPCIAGPTALCAAVALVIVGSIAGLSRWERRAAYVAGGLAVAAFGALVILG